MKFDCFVTETDKSCSNPWPTTPLMPCLFAAPIASVVRPTLPLSWDDHTFFFDFSRALISAESCQIWQITWYKRLLSINAAWISTDNWLLENCAKALKNVDWLVCHSYFPIHRYHAISCHLTNNPIHPWSLVYCIHLLQQKLQSFPVPTTSQPTSKPPSY